MRVLNLSHSYLRVIVLLQKYTVGISTPTDAGIPGDIVYYDKPEQGGYVGWVYTLDKDWRRFGNIEP